MRNISVRVFRGVCVIAVALATCSANGLSAAITVTPEELQESDQWVQQNLLGSTQPFSFTYNGRSSSALLSTWSKTMTTTQLDAQRTQRDITWTDPTTKLQVQCSSVQYANYPVVEWTTYFRNTGTSNTPLLKDIQGLNSSWTSSGSTPFVLKGMLGDTTSVTSYQPYSTTLASNTTTSYASVNGLPTHSNAPYYNIATPNGGVMMGVGWPGQWATSFTRNSTNGLQITAGQQTTSLYLKPGEQVRSPMVSLCTYQGSDTVRAQNIWRRWMLNYSLPGATGQPMPTITASTCDTRTYHTDATNEIADSGTFIQHGAQSDYWWIDAGWYPCDGSWWNTGTWEPDTTRYPNGITEVSDYLHANRQKLIAWFEPERAVAGSWLAENHPEWLSGGSSGGLLNLGDSAARTWLLDKVSGLITSQGIDVYRQDFNVSDPLSIWRNADGANRNGITENQYIQGYLKYIDSLRSAHPELAIDNCASGGRRNDLESLRRSVPLWRTDYCYHATANQCMTYGLASWIPYSGTGTFVGQDWGRIDNYNVRSAWGASTYFVISDTILHTSVNWTAYARMLAEEREAAPYLLGDFYPLTPYSQDDDVWMAWQYDRSDLGGGIIQAFRRESSLDSSMLFLLSGLDPTALYRLTDVDTGEITMMLGASLMTNGYLCELDLPLSSAVIMYQIIPEPSTCILGVTAMMAGLMTNAWRKRRCLPSQSSSKPVGQSNQAKG